MAECAFENLDFNGAIHVHLLIRETIEMKHVDDIIRVNY